MGLQGLPVMTLANFKEMLLVASSLAMSGCLFLGELPAWLAETEIGIKVRFRLQNCIFFFLLPSLNKQGPILLSGLLHSPAQRNG
jgi:hypothetical protein